jgi:hypothetical protein
VLRRGFKRSRHYRVLAPTAKAARVALSRPLLAMAPSKPRTVEAVGEFMQRVAAIERDARCGACRAALKPTLPHRRWRGGLVQRASSEATSVGGCGEASRHVT